MADIVIGRPFQDLDRRLVLHQQPEPLARLVPVDEKDDARAHPLEKGRERGGIRRDEAAERQVEEIGIADARDLARADLLPGEAGLRAQALQKAHPRQVDVAVGERHPQAAHLDDEDMRLGRADIVLDQQRLAGAGGDGVKAGMIEFERRRAVHPGHERRDRGAIGLAEAVGPGAGDLHRRDGALQPIDLLVQIHDEKVDAIARLGTRRGQRRDLLAAQHVIGGRRSLLDQPLQAGAEARMERRGIGALLPRHLQRRDHGAQRLVKPGDEPLRAGDVIIAAPVTLGPRDRSVEGRLGEAAGFALGAQGRWRRLGVLRLARRDLQQGQNVFGALIRGDGAGQQRRHHQRALAEKIDDLRFRRHLLSRSCACRAAVMTMRSRDA